MAGRVLETGTSEAIFDKVCQDVRDADRVGGTDSVGHASSPLLHPDMVPKEWHDYLCFAFHALYWFQVGASHGPLSLTI